MKVEINNIVIDAMKTSIASMDSHARSLEHSEEYKRNDSVGEVIRGVHSSILTEKAIIEEFVERCEKQKSSV